MKKFAFSLFLIFSLLLAGCVQMPVTETPAPSVTVQPPTETAVYYSPLFKTYMFDEGSGWAINLEQSEIYNTINYGEHWINVTPEGLDSPDGAGSMYLAVLDGSFGWVCQPKIESPSVLYTTDDGGRSWKNINLDFSCGNMAFISENEGMIVSDLGVGAGSHYVSIYTTEDAGATWTEVFKHDPSSVDDHGLPSSGIKSSFSFIDKNIALIGGSRPMPGSLYLFRSDDGGFSWSQVECEGLPDSENSELDPMDIIRINNKDVIVPIRAYLENGQMGTHFCSSNDAGASFKYLSTLENIEFSDFGSLNTGLAYGEGRMLQTLDGGLTWQDVSAVLPSGLTPVSLSMVNEDFGYLTTTISPDTLLQNRIFMTDNNGSDWQAIPGILIESISN